MEHPQERHVGLTRLDGDSPGTTGAPLLWRNSLRASRRSFSGGFGFSGFSGKASAWFLCLLCLIALVIFLADHVSPVSAQSSRPLVYTLDLEAAVTPAQADLLRAALSQAVERNAVLFVIRLDTPGGLLSTTRDMVKMLLNASVPVAVWVGPAGARAASAGVFLVAAARHAAMAPQTTMGAASPVGMGGGDVGETMQKKIRNDIQSLLRSMAEARERNVDWYMRAVDEAVSATATEAASQRVVDFIAPTMADVIDRVGELGVPLAGGVVHFAATDVTITAHEPGLRYRLLAWLLNPQIAYFLLLGGMAGLFFELSNPGAIFPGVLGAICLLLALYSLTVLPTNVAGILILLLGLVLFVLEIFITSYGLLSVAALVALFFGSLILFDETGGLPGLPLATIVTSVAVLGSVLGLIVYLVARVHLTRPRSGSQALIDQVGTVRTWEKTSGQIFIQGSIWAARSALPLAPGQTVRVVDVSGLTLLVEPALDDQSFGTRTPAR